MPTQPITINMDRKKHYMLNISNHRIRKQPIVLVQAKYVEIPQLINFIMEGKGPKLTLPSGHKDSNFKDPSMVSLIMQYRIDIT